MIARHPEWDIAHRDLMSRLDLAGGTVDIDGKRYPLTDTRLPTVSRDRPLELSAEEQACMERTRQSFLTSDKLWQHMQLLCARGSTYLVRDDHLIFHGCIPVDTEGTELPLSIDGVPHAGRALFDAFDRVIARALRQRRQGDLDLLWYLWCGPRSPLFGKDRITTFERHFVEDEATHHEGKNTYWKLIHDTVFCRRVLASFGVDPERGMIVNGHVPVKLERGEDPVKKSGKAVTIDGEFAEAYGDHGFTLVLDPSRTFLAEHHHFESVAAAVERGEDIIPSIRVIAERPTRHVADTERGREIAADLALLRALAHGYRSNQVPERST
jgi:fructose-1,6-bisphosphatase-3